MSLLDTSPQREEEARQLTLWEYKNFFYHAFVSNLSLKPAATYRFYNGRANAELDLRELKEGLPLGKIPTTSFTANATHFELTLLAYDLTNWFRRLCLAGKWQTARLHTLRHELFMLPARLLKVKHHNVLKLPDRYPHRKRFEKAVTRIRTLRLPCRITAGSMTEKNLFKPGNPQCPHDSQSRVGQRSWRHPPSRSPHRTVRLRLADTALRRS